MLRLLRKIAQDYHKGGGSQGNQGGRGAREGDRNRNHRTLDNANFALLLIELYCWTHGGYNLLSRDYTRKAQGYRDEDSQIAKQKK